jgi:hypothetical protein
MPQGSRVCTVCNRRQRLQVDVSPEPGNASGVTGHPGMHTALNRVCNRCGAHADDNQLFCMSCGSDLRTSAPGGTGKRGEPASTGARELAGNLTQPYGSFAPPPPPAAARLSPALAGRPPLFWLAGVAAILMIVGGFAPWATALNIISVSGTQGDGWIVIGAGVFACVMLWLNAARGSRGPLVWLLISGVLGAVVGIVDFNDVNSKGTADFFGQRLEVVKPGWGIYMVMAASIALVILAAILLVQAGDTRGRAYTGMPPPAVYPPPSIEQSRHKAPTVPEPPGRPNSPRPGEFE